MNTKKHDRSDSRSGHSTWRRMLCLALMLGAWQATAWAEEPAGEAMTEEEMRRAGDAYYLEVVNQPNERGEYSYYVHFDEPSMADEQKERRRLQLPPEEHRTIKFDPHDSETESYRAFLELRQSEIIATIESALGRELRVVRRFVLSRNRITTWLTPEEAKEVAGMLGVSKVERQPGPFYPQSSRSPRDVRARDYLWTPFPGVGHED